MFPFIGTEIISYKVSRTSRTRLDIVMYSIAGKFHRRKFHDFAQNQTFRVFNFMIPSIFTMYSISRFLAINQPYVIWKDDQKCYFHRYTGTVAHADMARPSRATYTTESCVRGYHVYKDV